MKTKRFPLFYVFLLVLILAVIVGTEIGKKKLKDVLAEYEDSQYKYVAEDFFESNFDRGDGASFAALFAPQLSSYETEGSAAEYFEKLIDGQPFALQSSSTGLEDRISYTVKCGETRFASMTVEKNGETTSHGFPLYKVSEVLLNPALLSSYSIEVPVGYTLFVNGKAADAAFCLGDRIETESQKYMPEGVDGIVYTTYRFDGLCTEPTFIVQSANGKTCEIRTSEAGIPRAAIVYDDALAEKYDALAKEAAIAYAKYMQNDAYFSSIKKYFDPDSALYTNIRTAETVWVIDHNSYEFKDVQTSEFYGYGDTVFSCRVSLTHVLKYRGLKDYTDYMDMTWYFRLVDGEFRIYDSHNNK